MIEFTNIEVHLHSVFLASASQRSWRERIRRRRFRSFWPAFAFYVMSFFNVILSLICASITFYVKLILGPGILKPSKPKFHSPFLLDLD